MLHSEHLQALGGEIKGIGWLMVNERGRWQINPAVVLRPTVALLHANSGYVRKQSVVVYTATYDAMIGTKIVLGQD